MGRAWKGVLHLPTYMCDIVERNLQRVSSSHSSNTSDKDHGTSLCHLDANQNENNGIA